MARTSRSSVLYDEMNFNEHTLSVPPFFAKYIALWASFCLVAIVILAIDRRRLLPEWRVYFRFLCMPWKLCVFAPAFLFVTFAGPYTDDETWDVVTGAGMSLLTFLTAPWSIGLMYQVLTGRRPLRYLVVASALLFFSSSWFYDGYLLLRDGAYTPRWWANLILSSIIYTAAGLLWNLEAKERLDFMEHSDFRFSFVRPDWPQRSSDTRFVPLLPLLVPLVLIAAYVIVAFVHWDVHMPAMHIS